MDFRGTDGEAMTTDTIEAATAGDAAAEATKGALGKPYPVEVDHGRDALLTDFGKETLKDR